ncbi:MAG TPA: dodecin family protein [Chitinophagaceae bacterium]
MVLKVIEIMAHSDKSWEDAAQKAIDEAGRTLHNIRSIYIKEQSAVVRHNKIQEFRITGKISFEIEKDRGNN